SVVDQNARETRDQLSALLRQYPPSLSQVLQLDPSLLAKDDYLAPYPALAAFVKQHGEIVHNPSFFLGRPNTIPGEDSQRIQTMRQVDDTIAGILVFCGLMAALASAVHLIRGLIDHRRWLQSMKIQTDAHTKIIDRLTNNEDLLAYLQSPSGQKWLAIAPSATEPARATAPIARILWSLQTGLVVAIGGGGLWIASAGVFEELSQALRIVATLSIAVGIGFIVSAIASFLLSRQLGLIAPTTTNA